MFSERRPRTRAEDKGKERPSRHGIREATLALALLVSPHALAEELRESAPPIERVQENRADFRARLEILAAQPMAQEVAWVHIRPRDEAEYSLNVGGQATPTIVVTESMSAINAVLAGSEVEQCHTHTRALQALTSGPLPAPSFIQEEGTPVPIDAPSPTDMGELTSSVIAVVHAEREAHGNNEQRIQATADRLTHCVVTSSGGRWTYRVAHVDKLLHSEILAYENGMTPSMRVTRFLDTALQDPDVAWLFSDVSLNKHGDVYLPETIARAVRITLAYYSDGFDEASSPRARFARALKEIAEPFIKNLNTPVHRLRESSMAIIYATEAGDTQGAQEALASYLATAKEELGIEMTWTPPSYEN